MLKVEQWGCCNSAKNMCIEKVVEGPTLQDIIDDLNEEREHVKLILIEVVDRMARIEVTEPEILIDRMGSTGATCTLASITYTLTSLEGIDSVFFDIPDWGNHANPGEYKRSSFEYLLPYKADTSELD